MVPFCRELLPLHSFTPRTSCLEIKPPSRREFRLTVLRDFGGAEQRDDRHRLLVRFAEEGVSLRRAARRVQLRRRRGQRQVRIRVLQPRGVVAL